MIKVFMANINVSFSNGTNVEQVFMLTKYLRCKVIKISGLAINIIAETGNSVLICGIYVLR